MSTDVTRAEPVGSLLWPQRLLDARAEHQAGRLGRAELKRVEDAEVDAAVADVPGVRDAIHLCRGNRDGHWMSLDERQQESKLRLVVDVARRVWPG